MVMKKTDTVMFKILALTIGLILCSSSADVIAQTQNQDSNVNYYSFYQKKIVRMDPNPSITLKLKNVPLKKALKKIAAQAEAGLYYDPDLLPDKRVNVSLQKTPLGEALRTVLNGTSLVATTRDRNIILHKRENNINPVSVNVNGVNLKTASVQKAITGTVTDATTKEALPGVNVVVKGTTIGTATDGDGHYSLSVPDDADTLIFSYIGYQTQQVLINGRSKINVALQAQTLQGQQLVVVGYGTQKKALVTGATVHESGATLAEKNTTNVLQAMQGQTPGVNITPTSGQPGAGLKVNIRGVGTIGNSNPLYVVDGVITGDISYLDPDDIASIDVLKDAASAAIYGVNGANGVVLITTKGGNLGSSGAAPESHISIDTYYGWQNLARKVHLLNAKEYATIMNEAAVNSNSNPYFTQTQVNKMAPGTNWMNQMFSDNVPTQNESITITGGSVSSVYAIAFSHTDQGGILGGSNLSNYERFNFRLNTERKMYGNFLRIGEHLTYSHVNQRGVQDQGQYDNSLRGAFQTSPFLAMYNKAGNFLSSKNSTFYKGGPWDVNEANPYALMVLTNKNITHSEKFLGDAYAEIQPIKGLNIKSTFGLEYDGSNDHTFTPTYDLSAYAFTTQNSISQNNSTGYTWNWDNTANYIFDINQSHFDVLAGTSIRKYQGSWMYGSNQGTTLFNDLQHAYLSNSSINSFTATYPDSTALNNTISLTGNANSVIAHASFFGRINYNYKQTYLATAVFRYDGSTRFAKGHQWGAFPSFSAGWVVSNEKFMKPLQHWLDFLKLRGGWGINGNDNISTTFAYESLIALSNATYQIGGSNVPGSYPSTIGTPDLKWETSQQLDFGFDAGLFNDQLSVNFDWYNKKTKNWLIQAPLLATAGVATPPYINGGDVTNKGIELQLTYNNHVGTDFRYSITGTYTYNKNEVTSVPTEDGIIHGGTNILFNNSPEFYRAQAGYPIGYFWGYKTDGIFQNEAQIQSYKNSKGQLLQPNAQPGDVRYVDTNGDGKINADDKTDIGDPNPHNLFGGNISLNYKNFDFSLTASGVSGNKIVQSYGDPANMYANWTTAVLNRWHGEGTSNTYPRVTLSHNNWTKFSDLYVHDGSYLRITNITLGYDFANLIKFKYLSECRLYVSANNLLTFTKYNGMDPAVGFSAQGANSNYNFGQGVDVGFYPTPKTYLMGLRIKF